MKRLFTVVLSLVSISLFGQSLSGSWSYSYPDNDPNARMGREVVNAGDVNDDTYEDLLVSVHNEDKIFVFYGSADGLSTTPWEYAPSGTFSYQYGKALSGGGDLNDDGIDDIVVSHTGTVAQDGEVYVYFGQSGGNPNTTNRVKVTGFCGQNFGFDVDSDGDFNGDGVSDLVISATYSVSLVGTCFGTTRRTGLYVIYGDIGNSNNWGNTPIDIDLTSTSADYSYEVTSSSSMGDQDFGWCAKFIGDINNDGKDDIAVSDPFDNGTGRVFLFGHDGSSYDLLGNMVGFTDSEFGKSIDGLGDMDGDGYDDFIIGAQATSNSSNGGQTFAFLGGTNTTISGWVDEDDANWSFGMNESPAQYDMDFGSHVAGLGDVNGDGYRDLAISARKFDAAAGTDAGAVKIYFGDGTSTQPSSAEEHYGANAGDEFGTCVTNYAPKGYNRQYVAIGSPMAENGSYTDVGKIELYDNLPDYASRGRSMANLGDINSDGLDDIAIGLPDIGRVEIYSTTTSGALSSTPLYTITHGGHSGISLAAIDLDGDTDLDLVIGDDEYNDLSGITYFHENTAGSFSGDPDFYITGEATDYRFGFDMANVGDVDNDGDDDLLIGAPGTNSNEGRAFLWQATSFSSMGTTSGDADWIKSRTANSRFGHSVIGGDVNGDGINDLIIGDNKKAKVSVFLGQNGAVPSTTVTWTATHTTDASKFGASVACGDLDGDGFDDIAVGAPVHNGATSYSGGVYVWFGGTGTHVANWATDPANADWHSDDALGNRMGHEVFIIDGYDEDDYADLVVGTTYYDGTGSSGVGIVQVFRGTHTRDLDCRVDEIEAPSHSGSDASQEFGTNFLMLNDLNSDNLNELVISAKLRDLDGTDDGEVFIEMGATIGAAELGDIVSVAGDINGDGYSDLLAVHTGDDFLQICFGSPTGYETTPTWQFPISGIESAATATDVNADGYSDIVVGIPSDNSNNGKVQILAGNNTGCVDPIWYATGTSSEQLGKSVTGIGDFNDDGYGDFVVGAPGSSSAYIWKGRTDVNFASNSGGNSGSADWGLSGGGSSDFGLAVGAAGDVNSDGKFDLLVGEPSNALTYLFLGRTSSSTTQSWIGNHGQTSSKYGFSLACAGDLNGDGYSDVVIGAPDKYTSGGVSLGDYNGEAYVYFGFSGSTVTWNTDPTSADIVLTNPNTTISDDNFGQLVRLLGDLNGDGYSEIGVGSPNYDHSGASDGGSLFIYYGQSDLSSGFIVTDEIEGDDNNELVGQNFTGLGDVNGDGIGDFVWGAYDNSQTEWDYTLQSGATSLLTDDYNGKITHADFESYGFQVSNAGDVNGDGFDDLIVAAPFDEHPMAADPFTTYDGGYISVYHGDANGEFNSTAEWTGYSKRAISHAGFSLSSGDFNGDGYSDVIIGSPQFYTDASVSDGAIFVFFGSKDGISNGTSVENIVNGNSSECWKALSTYGSGDGFGYDVACLDMNADGYDDVVATAPYTEISSGVIRSQVYVYLGGANASLPSMSLNRTVNGNLHYFAPATNADYTITRPYSIWTKAENAHDVNGDGFSDLLISYQESDDDDPGNEYVELFLGQCWGFDLPDKGSVQPYANLTDKANWKSNNGSGSTNQYGFSMSGLGDVNNDGYDDVAIGAPLKGNGTVYVIHGKAAGLQGTNDGISNDITTLESSNLLWKVTGSSSEGLGFSLSTAGDVNGSGYGDLLIGTEYWQSSSSPEEYKYSVYVFATEGNGAHFAKGGSTTSSSADWHYDFESGDEFFDPDLGLSIYEESGISVSSLGDMNGDGYGDIVVGVPFVEIQSPFQNISYMIHFNGNENLALSSPTVQFRDDLVSSTYNKMIQTGTGSDHCGVNLGQRGYSLIGNNSGKLVWEIGGESSPFSSISSSSVLINNYSEGVSTSNGVLNQSSSFEQISLLTTTLDKYQPNASGYVLNSAADLSNTDVFNSTSAEISFSWRCRMHYNPINAIDGQLYGRWFYPGHGDKHDNNFKLDEECYETGFCESIPYEEPQSVDETVVDDMTTAVYPSPATSQLNLKIDDVDGQARILSFDGKEMLTHINLTNGTTQVDISSLPEGMYLVEITTSEGTSVHKFRKE